LSKTRETGAVTCSTVSFWQKAVEKHNAKKDAVSPVHTGEIVEKWKKWKKWKEAKE
jgi:hypothetical protein